MLERVVVFFICYKLNQLLCEQARTISTTNDKRLVQFFARAFCLASGPLGLCLALLLGLRLLCLLLVLTERLGQELLELGVLQLLLRLNQLGLVPHRWVGDERGTGREKRSCEVEGSDEGICWRVTVFDNNQYTLRSPAEAHVHNVVRLD